MDTGEMEIHFLIEPEHQEVVWCSPCGKTFKTKKGYLDHKRINSPYGQLGRKEERRQVKRIKVNKGAILFFTISLWQ